MANDETPKNRDRGYGKPPKEYQFRPGQTGNPRGRPRKIRPASFGDVVREDLDSRVSITENGETRSITKREAMAKTLVNLALSGPAPQRLRAVQALIQLGSLDGPPADIPPSQEDRLRFLQMLADKAAETDKWEREHLARQAGTPSSD